MLFGSNETIFIHSRGWCCTDPLKFYFQQVQKGEATFFKIGATLLVYFIDLQIDDFFFFFHIGAERLPLHGLPERVFTNKIRKFGAGGGGSDF